jgi:ABC-type phosphate/phosphonate transport system permease subunit
MTFREKSIVAQFVAIVLVYGFFAFHYWGQPLTHYHPAAIVIGIGICMTLITVPVHIAFAIFRRPEKLDERDAAVDVRGTRNAYRVLGASLWCILMLIMFHLSYELLFVVALGTFALAELVRLGSQFYYYRFGA